MRIIYIIWISLCFNACKISKTNTTSEEIAAIPENQKSICPNNGECSVTTYQNSSLILKKDTTGRYYPVIEDGNKIVVEYKFIIKGPEGTVDGDYSETIHFEIESETKNLIIQDKDLSQIGLVYGKHCFCKGEAGYYKINTGKMRLQKSNKNLIIDLKFTLDQVSHKLPGIKEQIIL